MVLTEEIKKKCVQIMDRLMERPCALMFLKPVNPDEDGVPDYFSVVKHPVDLGTIRQNLVSNKYKELVQWETDMRYIWGNAEKFNKKDSVISKLAFELKKHFRKEYKKLKNSFLHKWTLEASRLKNNLDYLLDNPPDLVNPYAIISVRCDEIPIKDYTDDELSQIGRDSMLLTSPNDQKKLESIILKYKAPSSKDPVSKVIKIDINTLSTQAIHELKSYTEKRLTEMGLSK